ncbi:MAG: hypothetical protein AMXMBFR61_25990 [Fimbriimonadales bacterium]
MKLTCRLVRIRLARLVALGEDLSADSRLAAHVAECSDCAREWAALSAVADDLPRVLPALQPSSDFVARTLRRLNEEPRPARTASWLPLPAAIVLAALLVFFAWWVVRPTPSSPTGGEEIADTQVPPPEPAPSPVPPPVAITQPNDVPQQVVSDSVRTPTSARKVHRKAVAGARKSAPSVTSGTPTAAQPTETPTETVAWEEWGDWYAEAGAYAHASDAYARAYESAQDSDLAYATGYTAEAAGDVYQAITYYSQYLTQADDT